MKTIFSLITLVLLITNNINAKEICSTKSFVTKLITEENSWEIKKNLYKYTPIEKIKVDKNGTIWIQTYKASDPFPAFIAIVEDMELEILLTSIRYNLELPEYKEFLYSYDNKKTILMFNKNCDLSELKIKILINEYSYEKATEEFIFESK